MRNLIKLLVRFAVTLGLLVWVISRVDVRGFCETVKQARLGFLAAVWTIAVGVLWFESVKMRLILTQQGCDLKTGNVFGASAVCSLYSMVMPGSLSTGVKWYILKGNTGKGSNVFSSMMYNQLTEMAIVVVLGLGAFIVRNPLNRWQIQAVSAGVLLLVSAGDLLFLFSDRGVRINRFLRKILRVFPGRIRKAGEKVFTQIETFQRLGWRFHLTVLILTAISFVVRGCGIYFFPAAPQSPHKNPMPFNSFTFRAYHPDNLPYSSNTCHKQQIRKDYHRHQHSRLRLDPVNTKPRHKHSLSYPKIGNRDWQAAQYINK